MMKREFFYKESVMNTRCLSCRCILFLGILVVSLQVCAAKKPTDKERKDRADIEYVRCMAIAEKDGVHAMLRYIRDSQKGTSLLSSPEKLAQENCAADGMGFNRYQNLDEIVADDGKKLVPVKSLLIRIKDDVPEARHVARPWTRDYIIEIANYLNQTPGVKKIEHSEVQLLIASLIRSRVDQDGLSKIRKSYQYIKKNLKKFLPGRRSFADCSSKAICSTHLTGATVDISRLGVDKKKLKILATRLLEDREKGRILAIVENVNNCFHVFVIPPEYVEVPKVLVKPRVGFDGYGIHIQNPAKIAGFSFLRD